MARSFVACWRRCSYLVLLLCTTYGLLLLLLRIPGVYGAQQRVWRFAYCMVLCCVVPYYVVLHCVVLYCVVLYCMVLHCVLLYCVVLYCMVLHCVVLQYVVLY